MRKSMVIMRLKPDFGKSSRDFQDETTAPLRTDCLQAAMHRQLGTDPQRKPLASFWIKSSSFSWEMRKRKRMWINKNGFKELRWSQHNLYTREGSRGKSTSWAAACLNSAHSPPSPEGSWEYLFAENNIKNPAIGEVFNSTFCSEDVADEGQGAISTSLPAMEAPPEPSPKRDALLAPELHLQMTSHKMQF